MTRPKPRSKPKSDVESAVVAAAFRQLAARPWQELTIATVARAAKTPLASVVALAPSRTDLVALLLREVGREAARSYRGERGQQNIHERLFDAVMGWFDVLGPRGKAVRGLVRGLARDPLTLLSLRGEILRVSQTLLALAEADAGRSSPIRAASLAIVIARAVPVWLNDGTEMERTMAQIDRDLRRLDWLF